MHTADPCVHTMGPMTHSKRCIAQSRTRNNTMETQMKKKAQRVTHDLLCVTPPILLSFIF